MTISEAGEGEMDQLQDLALKSAANGGGYLGFDEEEKVFPASPSSVLLLIQIY
jgi:hypothetical protein